MVSFLCCKPQLDATTRDWEKLSTVEDLWEYQPDNICALFSALNTDYPGLSAVKSALVDGDTIAAAKLLLEYYQEVDREWVIPTMEAPPQEDVLSYADDLISDTITLDGHRVNVPITGDGGWKWNFTGPDKDDEFGYSLNGQKYLSALLVAYEETGRVDYPSTVDRIVKDWIVHHPLPSPGDSIYIVLDTTISLDWRDIGEVEWRTLETGHRLGAIWPQVFFALQKAPAFSPATRLLMLKSFADQAEYLRQYHKAGHNWTTMEMNGLALAALAFPEFKHAGVWSDYALAIMKQELGRQVYPDGTQTEISTKTQWVALRRFESVADNFKNAGRPLPEDYIRRVELMYNYLAYSLRPDGHQPLNNDSDRDDLRPRLNTAAEKFDRPDWEWITTNGKKGTTPGIGPTITYPWAGIHIMRTGWDEMAQWSFFDTGPYGTGHQHRDNLHLSVSAFGQDLLVDGGRYTHQDYFSFDPTIWRGYFRSSFSHNIILVDGQGQNAGPLRAKSALVEGNDYMHGDAFDYAHGTFSNGYEQTEGLSEHSRSVLYVHDRYWIVLDQMETDRPRELQVLWHFAPDLRLQMDGKDAFSNNPEGANLRIVPLGDMEWGTDIIKGQESPHYQGWYSANYGIKVPNPTVIYKGNISRTSTFAWLLIPALGEAASPKVDFRRENGKVILEISEEDGNVVRCVLPVNGNASKVELDL